VEHLLKRKLLNFLWIPSLVVCVAICWLWVRGAAGIDEVRLEYDRYLSNGRAASNAVYLKSDHRLWLNILGGSVAPFDGQLSWGYHIRANNSQGKPRFGYGHRRYATSIFSCDGSLPTNELAMTGWGPLRWQDFQRSGNADQFRSISLGVSHWVVVVLFLLLPLRRLQMLVRSRYAGRVQSAG
jgi:hypothetical protein